MKVKASCGVGGLETPRRFKAFGAEALEGG